MDIRPFPAQMIVQMEYEEGFHDGYRQAMREMPKIVRCKNCIFGEQINDRYICTNAGHCQSKSNEPNWYCADGKRKDDGDE